jgi:hypothetical protein
MHLHIIFGLALLGLADLGFAKPMTESVASWEGQFNVTTTHYPIRIGNLPGVILWLYKLPMGSQGGTPIGFSTESGDMIYQPIPNHKGTQPIYRNHVVVQNSDLTADIIVTYNVQGNGGLLVEERYRYDGKTIVLKATRCNTGKPNFKWFNEEDGKSTPARRVR